MGIRFVKRQAKKYGRKYDIPPAVLLGLIKQESGFNPRAVSSAGAKGLTQFIPSTAKAYGVRYGGSRKAQKTQIRGAAHYLSDLGFSKNRRQALGNYYGDPSSSYASSVLANAAQFRGATKGLKVGPGKTNVRTKKTTIPGQSFATERMQAQLNFIRKEDKTWEDYAGIKDTLKSLEDIPAKTVKEKVPGEKGQAKKSASGKGGIVSIAQIAQQMGLHVGENPKFGGVSGVHTKGSYHYSGRAIDVSGDVAAMRRFARRIDKLYGRRLTELFWNGPGARNRDNGKRVGRGYVSGHTDHVHVAL